MDSKLEKFLTLGIISSFMIGARDGHAELPLNFQPRTTGIVASAANVDCFTSGGMGGGMGMGGGCGMGGGMMGGRGTDPTPFLQQVVIDPATNITYYHVIIGNPAIAGTDFALEYYVRTTPSGTGGATCYFGCANARVGGGMGGGGMGGGMGGGGPAPLSSSSGTAANENNPLSINPAISGNATGNPTRVYMRMINNEPGFTDEFIKAKEANKPKITQTVTDQGIAATFSLDMSALGYTGTQNTPGTIVNKLVVTSPGLPAGSANFDIADFAATRNVTGGRYTYTPGTGDGGSAGRYSYAGGPLTTTVIDWPAFCDPAQNAASRCVTFGRQGMMGGGGGMGGGGMGGGM